jgi:hypothetical protein
LQDSDDDQDGGLHFFSLPKGNNRNYSGEKARDLDDQMGLLLNKSHEMNKLQFIDMAPA